MKTKVLHEILEPQFVWKDGKFAQTPFDLSLILNWVNSCFDTDWNQSPHTTQRFRKLHELLYRYINVGPEEDFLNEINSYLSTIVYIGNIVPPGFFSKDDKNIHTVYVANFDYDYAPDILAAYDFSKLLALGKLDSIQKCQLEGCDRLFEGPKRAKWCSKTCGSKYRVRKKRKKDSM